MNIDDAVKVLQKGKPVYSHNNEKLELFKNEGASFVRGFPAISENEDRPNHPFEIALSRFKALYKKQQFAEKAPKDVNFVELKKVEEKLVAKEPAK